MQISFVGPKLKIDRARKHIDEIEDWLETISEENAEEARKYKAEDPERVSHQLSLRRPPGFSRIAAPIIGDAVHNLRSALDLAACAIVAAGGVDDPSKTYFPLRTPFQTLVASNDYQAIDRASVPHAAVILNYVKDYEAKETCLLWLLNQLNRIDKHQLLTPTLFSSSSLMIAIRPEHEDDPPPAPPGAIYGIPSSRNADGSFQAERELTPGTKAYLHNMVNGYARPDLLFAEGMLLEGQAVLPVLSRLADHVDQLVSELSEV